jgi:hypothetical protein
LATTNTVSIDNSSDNGSARLSYTNYNSTGLMPNSSLKKDNLSVNGTWKVTDKLTATASANYTHQAAIGRNSTGYNDNILSSMRQWMETNTDYQDLKTIYNLTHRDISWNYDSIGIIPILHATRIMKMMAEIGLLVMFHLTIKSQIG